MRFPIVIHKDKDSCYGVTVPDLPGCISAGETLDQAFGMAREAIECHVEGMLMGGQPIPKPRSFTFHQANKDFRQWNLGAGGR